MSEINKQLILSHKKKVIKVKCEILSNANDK